jgi:signal transduction histidine kinase
MQRGGIRGVLCSRDSCLNSSVMDTDDPNKMSISGDNQSDSAPTGSQVRVDDPQAKLAHELANLLDGSLRNVGLVMSSLREPPARVGVRAGEDEDLVHRLEAANQAMQYMATLIQRWMGRPRPTNALHHQARTLHDTIHSAINLLAPVAAGRGIAIDVQIDSAAVALPAGPIYPIVANAVRNSVEALSQPRADGSAEGGRITVAAHLVGNQIELAVADNGPGLAADLFDDRGRMRQGITTKEGGHGLGLALARDIARGLGGTLELSNQQPRGASLTLRYPVAGVMQGME